MPKIGEQGTRFVPSSSTHSSTVRDNKASSISGSRDADGYPPGISRKPRIGDPLSAIEQTREGERKGVAGAADHNRPILRLEHAIGNNIAGSVPGRLGGVPLARYCANALSRQNKAASRREVSTTPPRPVD